MINVPELINEIETKLDEVMALLDEAGKESHDAYKARIVLMEAWMAVEILYSLVEDPEYE